PGVLGHLARERGVHVLHIGTDFVFDGHLDRPYGETDTTSPLSVYGTTKLEGEKRLLDSGCACAVVRVQWTYGRGGANFITKFLDRARASDELAMVDDQIGAPTWTVDVARALIQLLQIHATGLYHYAAAGQATRFEVAQAVLDLLRLDGKRLRPCCTTDFPAAAERPLDSRFDCAKIDALPGIVRPPWRDSLTTFLSTMV
ncbi:MAG: sugar nucleotide-binding protein, partial [Lentisphaeria bacterium]|nr:sugar nucleotide-binding protein [Lentisphaeria bacterium]